MNASRCPKCGYSRHWNLRRSKRKCKRCRKEFSPRPNVIAGMRMDRDVLARAAFAFILLRTVRRVAEVTGLSKATAQKICDVFRRAAAEDQPPVFEGPAEVDETYIGGQRKNQRLHIRKRYPPRRGHGTQKLPIIGALGRTEGKVRIEVMGRKLDKRQVLDFVVRSVRKGARIMTDGFPYYRDLKKLGYRHEWIDHNAGEYVRGDVHTNGIEGFWGNMKRRMGTIGGMRRDRLGLFAGELAWRYNNRRLTDKQKADAPVDLIMNIGGKI